MQFLGGKDTDIYMVSRFILQSQFFEMIILRDFSNLTKMNEPLL